MAVGTDQAIRLPKRTAIMLDTALLIASALSVALLVAFSDLP
jgi:hypothetical protein